MANLNLSQFTEKTLVEDADWVFVWDTAGAISKKVSRNSLLNSGTLATSAPVTISQTWNDAAVAFTAFKVNATSTASLTGSLLLDLQVGGVSQFSVRKSGQVIGSDGTALLPTYGFFDAGWGTGFSGMYRYGTGVGFSTAGGSISTLLIQHTGVRIHNSTLFGWTNGTAEGTLDTILLRGGAANLHLGAADAAAPVAQTLSVQSVVAGTTNTAGQAFTIDGSQGTGTGAGGSLLFRTAAAGSSGSTVNALGTALTLTAPGYVVPKSWLLQNGFAAGLEMYGSDADALSRNVNSSRRAIFNGTYLVVNSLFSIGWSANNGSGNDGANFAGADTILVRDGVATLALRNSTAAQTFNVYGTYTSGTSYERLTLSAPSAANAIIGTNKGSGGGTARGLELQVDGSTRLTFPVSGNPTFATAVTFGLDINGQRDVYCGAGRHFRYPNNSAFTSAGAGIVVFEDLGASNATPRFQLGGTSASFPALKRSTTYLQARLADDSAFAPIQGKLTTDTAFTSGAITDTGYIVLYDSTGTAYKVACTPV